MADRLRVLGENLRRFRQMREMSQVDFARTVKMDRSYLSQLENATARSYPKQDLLRRIAKTLNLEIEELTGRETLRQVTPYESEPDVRRLVDTLMTRRPADRAEILRFAQWTADRLPAADDNVLDFVPFRPRVEIIEEEFRFPVAPEDFKQLDFDYPQPWHYWTADVPVDDLPALAAGPQGVPNLLNPRVDDVREVLDRVSQIVRVFGDSMEDRYFDGDLLRVDTRHRNPVNGDPVAVYCDDLGGSLIGFLKREDTRIVLVKKNKPRYSDVVLPPSGWILVGRIVEIVRRVERRERL